MIKTPALPKQFALDLSHSHQPTLENFLPGGDIALLSTLQKLVEEWKTSSIQKKQANKEYPLNHRWIYWWGSAGSGRSHLLRALNIAAENHGLKHFFLQANEPVSWIHLEETISRIAESDQTAVITVDDVDYLDEKLLGSLFRILNIVQASQTLYIFMSGNQAPSNLQIREDVRTRLGWGLVFQTQLLSDNEKIQALEGAAKARGLVLSSDVLPWLLNRFYRDMPNLMALLDALDAYSLETKRPVTLPLVRDLLQIGNQTT